MYVLYEEAQEEIHLRDEEIIRLRKMLPSEIPNAIG
jgi:hypothetical protein